MVQNMIPIETTNLNIADKINNLSGVKLSYIQFIMQLFDLLNDQILKKYAIPFIHLLQKIINIQNNAILLQLEDALSSVLITYIYDLTNLLNGHLDLIQYEGKHKNLLIIHMRINDLLLNYDETEMTILKEELFII
jgi:hypothetical protein